MRIADETLLKLLEKTQRLNKEQANALEEQAKNEKHPVAELIIKNGLVSEKDLTQMYAKEVDVPFVELNVRDIKRDILKLIPEKFARQYKVVLFGVTDEGQKLLAMDDPDDVQAISFLQKQLGDNIKVHVAPSSNISQAIDLYRGNISNELTKVMTESDEANKEEEEEVSEEDVAEDSPIAQTVNLLIEYAVKSDASDIHIEPREEYVSVRYRIDGVLKEANKLPKKVHAALVSRIKILSNLKIDERRAPQDGRFKIMINEAVYALRVSTLPIADGEKVVMRILSESNKALTLEELGYWGHSLDIVNHAIVQPYGMILVTGPTGSGKSTSLFSVLSMLNSPTVNISTVEDPVEYRIPGVNQTQVNPQAGMTFVNGLRALLRQDPNIIMVGEIRDGDTAGLAVQAALTGHLVFSTLHTNNAATCLPRLLDMNIEPFLIASTVRAVIGQRLVRRLCVDCRETYTPNVAILKQIGDSFNIGSATLKRIHDLEEQALAGGVGRPNQVDTKKDAKQPKTDTGGLSTSDHEIKLLWRPAENGCDSCGHSGYKGRMGIYEVLDNSSSIQHLIVSNATSEQIQEEAIKEGMVTMQLDGLIKALRGQTTIEEVLRVTSEK